MADYRQTPHDTAGLPPGIPYIIGNEAAERFSFYGMKTILVVFMTKYLHYMVDGESGTAMSDAAAREYYHYFVTATYFFPVFGSLLSDIFIGKYRTILWLSIVYCLGHGALALMGGAGMSPGMWLFMGLGLIAVGSGGIKPCVSAHVGDQFGQKNSHLMTRVFQWFYFSINFGSTFSTLMTPVLLKWYGPHVAFGIPGVLMAIATLLFWMGRNRFVHVPAGGKRFFEETFSREGIAALLKLCIIYAFIAVFWAVFDQTGSSWVLQAQNMDRRFLGINWLESQIQVVNPVLIMILIPVFQFGIYPAVDKVFRLTAIRKMSIGFFLTLSSFVLLMLAQQLIDQGNVPSIAWQLWAYLLLSAGEVMISITGLEFSYTQAPKSMKSVIMAVWLFSVSLGNSFTGIVNSVIQVPGVNAVAADVSTLKSDQEITRGAFPLAVADETSGDGKLSTRTITVYGADNSVNTADDVVMQFDGDLQLEDLKTSENDVLNEAFDVIKQAFLDSAEDASQGHLPSDEAGNQLIAEYRDSLGQELAYDQISVDAFRIISPGADKTLQTQWDIILDGTVSRAKANDPDTQDQPYTWLEKRIIAAKGEEGKAQVERERGNIPTTEISSSITVGGQDLLEGAAYFRFWVYVLLVTSVVFIPVGYFYKEKSYIQDESGEDSEADSPGDDAVDTESE